jgi:hypothetical protein
LYFESYRLAVGSEATAVSNKLMVEATASSHLGEVVGKAAAVVLVVALDEVLLDMVKDQLMMEEEKGRLPAIGAPGTPPQFLEFDQSYMVQHQGAPVRREPLIYDHGVQRQHNNYHNLGVQIKKARAANPYAWLNDKGMDYRFWSIFQFDFYKTVILAKEKKIVQMKYID